MSGTAGGEAEGDHEDIGQEDADSKTDNVALRLPLARVKKIAKADEEIKALGQDAVLAIGRATELFVGYLVGEGHKATEQEKRKILTYKDLAVAVERSENLQFLDDVIPMKVAKPKAKSETKRGPPAGSDQSKHGTAPAGPTSDEEMDETELMETILTEGVQLDKELPSASQDEGVMSMPVDEDGDAAAMRTDS